MWRPKDRVRYFADHGRLPTREEAARSRLFSSIAEGRLSLEQRTWVPAMVPWRATDDGFVSDAVVEWYARFARGRPGAIVVEATGIRDVPSGPLLRIGHDRFVPGLARLVEEVKRASGGHTKIFIQIIDFLSIRRRPEPKKFFDRFLTITDDYRSAVEGLDLPEAEVRERLFALGEAQWPHVLNRFRAAIASGLQMLSFRIFVTCRKLCRRYLRKLLDAQKTLDSRASNCTMRMHIQWPHFSRARTRAATGMAARSKGGYVCRLRC